MSHASRVAPRARAGARVRAAALGLLVLPALAGCVSEAREKELGSQIAANVNARVPLVQDVPLSLYVNDLGQLIARHSGRPGLQYHFYIVDNEAVNAFALPGGYVYVDRGLIERTHNVSELAGVLAHEIAHVALRHGAKNLQRQMRTSSMSTLLYRTILGRGPLLDQQALQMGNELWSAAHSRADEAAADQEAVSYLIATGIDPQGMVTALQGADGGGARGSAPLGPGVVQLAPQHREPPAGHREHHRAAMPHPVPRLASDNASYPFFLARMQMLPPAPPMIPMREIPVP